MNENKMNWMDRLRLCCFILIRGTTEGLPEYKTRRQQKQWQTCQKRQKELDAAIRPRTTPKVKGHCTYTDYYERD